MGNELNGMWEIEGVEVWPMQQQHQQAMYECVDIDVDVEEWNDIEP